MKGVREDGSPIPMRRLTPKEDAGRCEVEYKVGERLYNL